MVMNKRFPEFSKVVLAILEAKIENVIGKNAVTEIRAPYTAKELELRIQEASTRAENRLIAKYPNKDISSGLNSLKISDLPSVQKAILDFYTYPTNTETLQVLQKQIAHILPENYPESEILSAAIDYLYFLREELTAISEVRDRLEAISVMHIEQKAGEIEQILQSIDSKLGNIKTKKVVEKSQDSIPSRRYTVLASTHNPALIIFLIDVGYHMKKTVGDLPTIEIIRNTLLQSIQSLIFRSTKGGRISPRYHIGCFTYDTKVHDIFDGILPIDRLASIGIPEFHPTDKSSDTFEAFFSIENLLKEKINEYNNCPAPLICHISAGEYPCRNPESVTKRIKDISVPDGNVLIENILVDDETILIPATKPVLWSGIRDENELAKSYARQLFRMSSTIPESYRNGMIEMGYNQARNARMLYPGTQAEMVGLGFVTTLATTVASNV